MINDLRFALRMIRAHRWFSAAVVATLALGIGINTTVFTLVNAVLFKPVPLPGGERLMVVNHLNLANEDRDYGTSYPDFQEYRAGTRAFERLEALTYMQGTLSETAHPPERYSMGLVSAGMFSMLATPPVLGRDFQPADEQPGAEPVVLIGHSVWQDRYGGSPDVLERVVKVNGKPATIIGVMPAGFRFPAREDLWMPLVRTGELAERTHQDLRVFGLLKRDTSIAAATADLAVIGGRLAAEFPDTNKDLRPRVLTFHEEFNGGQIRSIFLMMLGAVGFVLLIACANVANMLLSRALTRRRELSVRVAVGASRWQLVRQLLVESVVLSVLGGLIGLALSHFGITAFDRAVVNSGKPYWIIFALDWRAFTYFAIISVASGLVFGLAPALRASRVDLNTALKDDTPGGGSARGHRLTGALVVLQFALTVVLLAGAGVMIRGFFAAQAVNPFVPADQLFTARLHLPEGAGERYQEGTARRQFFEQVMPRLAALPGVTRVAATSHLPGLGAADRPVEIEDSPNADPQHAPRAAAVIQSPDFLAAIGLPLLAGRGFSETDGDEGREVAIVTRLFASRFWPGRDALGRRFRFTENEKPGPWIEVVGISADIVQTAFDPAAPPVVHIPYRQEPWGWMGLVLNSALDPTTLGRTVRETIQQVDADLPLFEVSTLPTALDRQRWFLRVFGTLFGIFALTGLLMASVGIYAVVAQATARRTREIGIRMALGATSGGILRLVLSRGLGQLALGLGLGLAGAFGATHVLAMARLLFRTSPNDPFVFIAIALLLVGIGLFACWLPARRAARIEPTSALRSE